MTIEPVHLSWDYHDPTLPATLDDGRTEPHRAHQALLDYIQLGPDRTIVALLQQYQRAETAPIRSHGTLRNWSDKFEWTLRAKCYEALERKRAEAEDRAHRDAIMQQGLALDHKRIESLNALYEKLTALARDEASFWITDYKILRLPDGSSERVEIRRFNGNLVRQMRGLLADIAGEAGGRIPRPQPPQPENTGIGADERLDFRVLTHEESQEFERLYFKLLAHPVPKDMPIELFRW